MVRRLMPIIFVLIYFSCSSVKDKRLQRDMDKVVSELKTLVTKDQEDRMKKMKKIGLLRAENKDNSQKIDSLIKVQLKIDRENTRHLLNITKRYGFPDNSRLKERVPSWIIFQHTPEEYKEDVKKVLEKEHRLGRVRSEEYKMIMWHLNGRKKIIENS